MYFFADSFDWLHLHLDEHLGRDIRHDDVCEEIAQATQYKTDKQETHSHGAPFPQNMDGDSCLTNIGYYDILRL